MQKSKLLYICSNCENRVVPTLHNNGFGVATCKCDEYPILENIVYLTKDDTLLNRRITVLIKRRKYFHALYTALSGLSRRHKLITFLIYVIHRTFQIHIPLKVLLTIFHFVGPERKWFHYLLTRINRSDVLTIRKLLKKNLFSGNVFLDIGCGSGMLYDILRQTIPSLNYIGIDKNFFTLLLLRINIKEQITLICTDVEHGIPLPSKSVDTLVFLDAFSHIKVKRRVIDEVSRILKKKGVLCLAGMYKTLQESYFWGYGTGPIELKSLLQDNYTNIRFIDNKSQLMFRSPIKNLNQINYSCIALKK